MDSNLTRKFLCTGVLQSKKDLSKFYAVGLMWSDQNKKWSQAKHGETYGNHIVEISGDQYNKLSIKLSQPVALIIDAEISGYNDYNFPIWALKV